jgi:tetratricopeptide (TPR) repeat protein
MADEAIVRSCTNGLSRMMIRRLTARLALLNAPLVGLVLLTGCSQEAPAPQSVNQAETDGNEQEAGLRACADPALKAVDEERTSDTLPVAYPASQLERPTLIARPFPLADPQLPLPPIRLPQSVVREVRALPDEPITAEPGPAPRGPTGRPVEVTATPPRAPGRATFVSQSSQARPQALGQPARNAAATPNVQRRSAAMQAVNRQAEQKIRRGYHLAERGALYSARAEFIQALRTISQALDVQTRTRVHTQALSAGLTALEEAEDFVPDGSQLEADLDVATLIGAHRTPVCKPMDKQWLLPVIVLQHYYTYAQEQLALAAGGEEAASMALFGLGKTYSALAIEKTVSAATAEPKAMVFHWAALSAHAGNFLAANELAVLEARWGQYATARTLLQYSLATLPHSAVWRNLSIVHQRMGETKLADLAQQEARVAARREADAKPGNAAGIVPSSDVQWLDSKAFASTTRSEIDVQSPTLAGDRNASAKAAPVVAPAPPRARSAAAWFPWLR